MLNIIVASQNPSKIEAAGLGFRQFFPEDELVVEGVKSQSGVPDQPMNDAETFRGALNRCLDIRRRCPEADYWVAMEGGIHKQYDQMEAFAWIVIFSAEFDFRGIARTASFSLPPRIRSLIEEGYELGVADDMVFERNNSKHKNGAVGILTHDLIDRANYYAHAVVLALIPFKNPELYREF